jgi:CO dehydrogenase/acetyl-CoA synthase beta subunit
MGEELKVVCEREGDPDLINKIADGNNVTDVEDLVKWLQEHKHPALDMPPMQPASEEEMPEAVPEAVPAKAAAAAAKPVSKAGAAPKQEAKVEPAPTPTPEPGQRRPRLPPHNLRRRCHLRSMSRLSPR